MVAQLQGTTTSVRYVGIYLVYPRRHIRHLHFLEFKNWLLQALDAWKKSAPGHEPRSGLHKQRSTVGHIGATAS